MNRLLPLALLLALAAPTLAQPDPVRRFQEAVALEEERGDPGAALKAYRSLLDGKGTPLGLRAKALLRVAACQEKLGRLNQASATYRRVIRECGSFEALVKAARTGIRRVDVAELEAAANRFTVTGDASAIGLNAVDANVRDVMRGIARQGGLSLVISPDVRGNVTMDLAGILPLDALRLITETLGDFELIWSAEHRLAAIQTRSSTEQQLKTRVFRLKRRPVTWAMGQARMALHRDVANLIASSAIQGATAEYDAASQCFFVTTTRPGLADVARVLSGELATAPRDAPDAGAGWL
ncbi:MAG: hypothetical protein IIC87_07395 [Chloroflexi bacterium]|nr:hypothetical protein [Chloroflexota bacterium]